MSSRVVSRLIPLPLLFLLVAAGCGDDVPSVGTEGVLVGGPCSTGGDCSSNATCLLGGDFPGGACSVPCTSDGDCPAGSACISKDNGVCLLACTTAADCRAGYKCAEEDRKGAGSKAQVCIDD